MKKNIKKHDDLFGEKFVFKNSYDIAYFGYDASLGEETLKKVLRNSLKGIYSFKPMAPFNIYIIGTSKYMYAGNIEANNRITGGEFNRSLIPTYYAKRFQKPILTLFRF